MVWSLGAVILQVCLALASFSWLSSQSGSLLGCCPLWLRLLRDRARGMEPRHAVDWPMLELQDDNHALGSGMAWVTVPPDHRAACMCYAAADKGTGTSTSLPDVCLNSVVCCLSCRATFDQFLKAFFCVLFAAMGLAQAQVRSFAQHASQREWQLPPAAATLVSNPNARFKCWHAGSSLNA